MTTDAHMAQHAKPIRVLLVEDHDHVRWGLEKLIGGEWPRMKVAAAAKTVAQALAALRAERPDVVVLDLFLGEDNAVDHLPDMQAGGAVVLILTGSRDPDIHRRALQAGACMVVLKDEPADVLLREIERAHVRRVSPHADAARGQGLPAGSNDPHCRACFFNDTEMDL